MINFCASRPQRCSTFIRVISRVVTAIWVYRHNRDNNNNYYKGTENVPYVYHKEEPHPTFANVFFLADLMKSGKALKGLQERSGKGKRNMKKVNAIEKVLSITLWLYF